LYTNFYNLFTNYNLGEGQTLKLCL